MDFEGFFCDAAEGGEWMIDTLAKTATAHGVTVVHQKLVKLPQSPEASPPGFTAVCLLDESHATAHCYSDRGWLALDVFTCGGTDPRPVAADIRAQVETRWGARCVQFETHGRFLHHATSIPVPTHEIERKIIAALPLRTTKLQLRQGGDDAEEVVLRHAEDFLAEGDGVSEFLFGTFGAVGTADGGVLESIEAPTRAFGAGAGGKVRITGGLCGFHWEKLGHRGLLPEPLVYPALCAGSADGGYGREAEGE